MIKPIKDLGQNFLRNQQIIQKFVKEIDIKSKDIIYEIGPGEGVITHEILKNSLDFKLDSIDIDERSIEELMKIKDQRFNILHKDILKFLPEIQDEKYKIVGAIPYNITSPIIHRIIEKKNLPQKIVLIIQDEVAKKFVGPEKNSYFTFFIGLFYQMKYIQKISRNNFYPVPNVDSALITFELKENLREIDKIKYSNFLHKVFRSPRKKINKVFSRELLEKLNISEDLRPEDLKIEEVLRLFEVETNWLLRSHYLIKFWKEAPKHSPRDSHLSHNYYSIYI